MLLVAKCVSTVRGALGFDHIVETLKNDSQEDDHCNATVAVGLSILLTRRNID